MDETAENRLGAQGPIEREFSKCELCPNQAGATMKLETSKFRPGLPCRVAFGFISVLVLGLSCSVRADMTWLYAVQLSATLQTNPPQISLHWPPDELGADSYTVQRKLRTDTSWGPVTNLPGSATNLNDNTISIGSTYEYQIIKHG